MSEVSKKLKLSIEKVFLFSHKFPYIINRWGVRASGNRVYSFLRTKKNKGLYNKKKEGEEDKGDEKEI